MWRTPMALACARSPSTTRPTPIREGMRWSPDRTEILFASQDHHLRLIHPDGRAMTGINLPPGIAKGQRGRPTGGGSSSRPPRVGGGWPRWGRPTFTGPGRTARSHRNVDQLGLRRQLGPAAQRMTVPRSCLARSLRRPPGRAVVGVQVPLEGAEEWVRAEWVHEQGG
jgi:hypothetical protein